MDEFADRVMRFTVASSRVLGAIAQVVDEGRREDLDTQRELLEAVGLQLVAFAELFEAEPERRGFDGPLVHLATQLLVLARIVEDALRRRGLQPGDPS